jgi:hypothetical protein
MSGRVSFYDNSVTSYIKACCSDGVCGNMKGTPIGLTEMEICVPSTSIYETVAMVPGISKPLLGQPLLGELLRNDLGRQILGRGNPFFCYYESFVCSSTQFKPRRYMDKPDSSGGIDLP